MTLTKNQRKADSISRCLTTKWWTRSAASHFIETWNTRWTTSWTLAKTVREERSRLRRLKPKKNNRSLEKRPYPILSGLVLSRKRWSLIITKEWKLLAASSESIQRVTTVVSGRSVKCNAIFAVWIFAVVLLLVCSRCSPVWILHISNIWEHQAKVRWKNTHNIVLYTKIWFPGRMTFWILRLFYLVLCPLTTCTWQELTA